MASHAFVSFARPPQSLNRAEFDLAVSNELAPHDLVGGKNLTSHGAVYSRHEKQWRGCYSVSGAAQERSQMLRTNIKRCVWVCMRLRLPAAAPTASSAWTRFDFCSFHLKSMGHGYDALWCPWVRFLLQSAFVLRATFLCCNVEYATMCCKGRRYMSGKSARICITKHACVRHVHCMYGKHAPLCSAVQHHRSLVTAS